MRTKTVLLGHLSVIRNKTHTAVTNITSKRILIYLTLSILSHASSEETVLEEKKLRGYLYRCELRRMKFNELRCSFSLLTYSFKVGCKSIMHQPYVTMAQSSVSLKMKFHSEFEDRISCV